MVWFEETFSSHDYFYKLPGERTYRAGALSSKPEGRFVSDQYVASLKAYSRYEGTLRKYARLNNIEDPVEARSSFSKEWSDLKEAETEEEKQEVINRWY